MNASLTAWLLAGALAASLVWNVKGPRSSPPPPPSTSGCESGIDLSGLELTAQQRLALEDWNATACASSGSIDAESELKWQELQQALRDPAADVRALKELAAEVSRLRARSLETCVDSIVEVRRVLSADQLAALMSCCGTCVVSER